MSEIGNLKIADKSDNKEEPILQPPRYEETLQAADLAPDGGWGWVVVGGMILASLMTISQGSCFALVYGDFMEASGNGGSAVTSLNLMILISASSSGLICNELLKRYSIKPIGVIGALIHGVSNTIACLAPNVSSMAFLFFIQGLGIGITMNICIVSFNAYFVKRKAKVLGASQMIIGLGAIGYPLIAEKMLTAYGFRGCVALMGALSFNAVVGMLVMDPVHLHQKKSKNIGNKKLLKKEGCISADNIYHRNLIIGGEKNDSTRRHSMDETKEREKNKNPQNFGAGAEHERPLLIETLQASLRSQDRSGSGHDLEKGFRLGPGKGSLDCFANRLSITAATSMTSITGIGRFGQIPEVGIKNTIAKDKERTILMILGDFFEVSLLRDRIFLNLCTGCSLTFLNDMLFMNFLPMKMASEGYPQSEIALTLTVSAINELAGKALFVLYATIFQPKARYVYLGAVYCLVCCKIAYFYCDSLTMMLVVTGLNGFSRSWCDVSQTLVIAEHFTIEKFSAAWGVYTVISGLSALIVCPLIGFIKDFTQSYTMTQFATLGGLLMCLIPWTIEILFRNIFAVEKKTDLINSK